MVAFARDNDLHILATVENLFEHFRRLTEGDKGAAASLTAAYAALADRAASTEARPLSVAQAARDLGVSERTVRHLIQSGKLPTMRIGKGRGTHRISPQDFDAYKRGASGTPALQTTDAKRRLLKL